MRIGKTRPIKRTDYNRKMISKWKILRRRTLWIAHAVCRQLISSERIENRYRRRSSMEINREAQYSVAEITNSMEKFVVLLFRTKYREIRVIVQNKVLSKMFTCDI